MEKHKASDEDISKSFQSPRNIWCTIRRRSSGQLHMHINPTFTEPVLSLQLLAHVCTCFSFLQALELGMRRTCHLSSPAPLFHSDRKAEEAPCVQRFCPMISSEQAEHPPLVSHSMCADLPMWAHVLSGTMHTHEISFSSSPLPSPITHNDYSASSLNGIPTTSRPSPPPYLWPDS